MLKLFIKKPVWAVGFAAAAIFAVTLVGCASDSTSESASPFASENQAALFYVAGSDTANFDDPFAGASLVQSVGGYLSYATPAPDTAPVYYTVVFKDTVALTSEKKLVVGSVGEVYAYFPITKAYADYAPPTIKVVGEAGLLDTIGAGAEGDRYLCVKIDGARVGADSKVTGVTAGAWYKVSALDGATDDGYQKASAAGELDLTTGKIYLTGEPIPAASIFGDGTGTAAGDSNNVITSWAVENEVVLVTKLAGTDGGSALNKYQKVATGDKITLINSDNKVILTKVLSTADIAANIAGSAMTNATKWFKVTYFLTTAGAPTVKYYKGNGEGVTLDTTSVGGLKSVESPEEVCTAADNAIIITSSSISVGDLVKTTKLSSGALDAVTYEVVYADDTAKKVTIANGGTSSFVVEKVASKGAFLVY